MAMGKRDLVTIEPPLRVGFTTDLADILAKLAPPIVGAVVGSFNNSALFNKGTQTIYLMIGGVEVPVFPGGCYQIPPGTVIDGVRVV